jgi:uracil-DNA glycosylase
MKESNLYIPFELETGWFQILQEELTQPSIASLAAFVERERASGIAVYPPRELVFNAFYQTPFEQVKVLIMGQDPYHGPGQAHGLCFSVPKGVPPPPSLQNIFKELISDVGIQPPNHGCLLNWARNGVMLLNATLTVRQGEPMSHHGKGWERFTDAVISKLCQRKDPIIFVLWGKSAQEKCRQIENLKINSQHIILKAPHPSPLSAHQGFLGCKHFSKVNEILIQQKKTPIDWSI